MVERRKNKWKNKDGREQTIKVQERGHRGGKRTLSRRLTPKNVYMGKKSGRSAVVGPRRAKDRVLRKRAKRQQVKSLHLRGGGGGGEKS